MAPPDWPHFKAKRCLGNPGRFKVLEEAYNAVREKIQTAINEVPLYEATL